MSSFDVMMLPAVNATLNLISTLLLVTGYILIRRGNRSAHRVAMIAAFSTSALFLISYVTYHALRGGMSTPFAGDGVWRPVYYSILITHVVLAALVPFLAVITIRRALKGAFERHRRIARWTMPIWLYVSVTGVLVYLMLYQWFPAAAVATR